MALRTFWAVVGATRGWLLITRETVELETPASFATLLMDMRKIRARAARPLKDYRLLISKRQ